MIKNIFNLLLVLIIEIDTFSTNIDIQEQCRVYTIQCQYQNLSRVYQSIFNFDHMIA